MEEAVRQNMAMFERAMKMFPGLTTYGRPETEAEATPSPPAAPRPPRPTPPLWTKCAARWTRCAPRSTGWPGAGK